MAKYITPKETRLITQCAYCGYKGDHICETAELKRLEYELTFKGMDSITLERKLSKLQSYKQFFRRYTRDGMMHVDSIEEAYSLPSDLPSLEEQMIMKQTTEAYLQSLTDKQKAVVVGTDQGLKPKEIAAQQGESSSSKVRWHKFAAKEKLIEMMGRK